MGITEYVSSSHTFGVLICAKNDDLCAAAARRIQRCAPQYCGLYTYNSMSTSEVDPLYAFVARQYKAVLWLRTGVNTIPFIIGCAAGSLVGALQQVLQAYKSVTTITADTETTIFIPHTLIDTTETRNEFSDHVLTALQGVS